MQRKEGIEGESNKPSARPLAKEIKAEPVRRHSMPTTRKKDKQRQETYQTKEPMMTSMGRSSLDVHFIPQSLSDTCGLDRSLSYDLSSSTPTITAIAHDNEQP